jgi:hypothetical protein
MYNCLAAAQTPIDWTNSIAFSFCETLYEALIKELNVKDYEA